MDCKEAHRIIHLLAEGQLDARTDIELKQHFEHCAYCKTRHTALLEVYRQVEEEKEEFTYDFFLASRVWELAQKKNSLTLGSLPPVRAMLISSMAAAGVLLGVFLGSLLVQQTEIDSSANQEWNLLSEEYFPVENYFIPYEEFDSNH